MLELLLVVVLFGVGLAFLIFWLLWFIVSRAVTGFYIVIRNLFKQ